jgi:putative colanic acid biosynthesis UDP-glucose lipid carrier transferase
MNNRFLRSLQLTLLTLDLLSINAVFYFSQILLSNKLSTEAYMEYTYFGFSLNFVWLFISFISNIYHERYILSFELFAKRSMQAFVYFLIPLIFYLFFFRQYGISRIFILFVLLCLPVSLMINRFLYIVIHQYLRKKEYLLNKVLVIGYNSLSKKLVDYFESGGINKQVVGYCEEAANVKELSHYPILGDVRGALEICKTFGVTEIFSTIAPEHDPYIYQLIQNADQNCIRFRIVPDIHYFVNKQVHVDYFHEIPVITLRNEPLEDIGNRIRKRLFDIVVSSLVLVFILSWLIPLIGLLIWIESRGPIFFIQQRSGKDNKNFPCLKFRSMKKNDKADSQQATKNDDRITRIGKILRRTSLDEFPQFLNVLAGHMSIVGPRPHMIKHTDEYSQLISQYMVRQFLKPGITGWAQVNGYRGETKEVEQMRKRVEHDIWYMENWSSWLDVRIVFLTVYNTLRGEENAF